MVFHVIQLFAPLRKHGAHCVMATNPLASTDVPANKRGVSTDRQSLHAKIFSIENKQLFAGSFNEDP